MAQASTTRAELSEPLQSSIRGDIVDRDHPDYERARRVDNGSIDRYPELIVHCADAGDVIAALAVGREAGLDIAVRGGGHSVPGFGTVDDGLVIDLGPIRNVRVDPVARLADVGGGATLGDLDHATHSFGLATPTGVLSTTGVGGLTLGGGQGYLTRKHGLTIDNLLSADVVLADGSFVQASENENEDLFWALRGGSGNFGIVTSFSYRLHPVKNVVAGPMLWPLDRGAEVMRLYRDSISQAPEELTGIFAFVTVPPAPPFPQELHLQKVAGVIWCWAGPPERADEVLAPFRALSPALDGVAEAPYPAIQTAFDPLYPPGLQNYWRGHVFDELSDEAIERHVDGARKLPTPLSGVLVYPIDGAAARVGDAETAWAHRGARFSEVIFGTDPDPARFDDLRSWTVECWEALRPHASEGAYVNFIGQDGQGRVRPSYGPNYDRLAELKSKYDPQNIFHVNQNIPPRR
jgi:FAD binding domain-containing protein/berberine-like enzyme